jgi:hypothetical protein
MDLGPQLRAPATVSVTPAAMLREAIGLVERAILLSEGETQARARHAKTKLLGALRAEEAGRG